MIIVINTTDRELIDAAVAAGNVTKVKAGKARGVTKRTAPMTTTRKTKAQRKADGETTTRRTRSTRAKDKAAAPAKAPATTRPAGTFTAVDLAKKQGISAKTLRVRIRRNIEAWESLFVDGQRHVFKDNKTTWSRAEALLA